VKVSRQPNCPIEKGFCVQPNGRDQNSGVIKVSSVNGNTKEAQKKCLAACRARKGATGCEVIWDQGNRGCYIHTKPVARGNKRPRHMCWVFSKCKGKCPAGYQYTSKDIDGKGKSWSFPGKGVQKCAAVCNRRRGCTGFEYNWKGNERYKCGTYTGGKSNLKGRRTGGHTNWNTCVKPGVISALSVDGVFDDGAFEFDEGSRFGEFGFYAMWAVALAPFVVCVLINAYYACKYCRIEKATPYEKVDLIVDEN